MSDTDGPPYLFVPENGIACTPDGKGNLLLYTRHGMLTMTPDEGLALAKHLLDVSVPLVGRERAVAFVEAAKFQQQRRQTDAS